MTTKHYIISQLAKERAVETLAAKICRDMQRRDLDDLCQIIYLGLLTKDEDMIVSLQEKGEMPFYLTRMIKNQYNSARSPFHRKIRSFRSRCQELSFDLPDD